jgi:hypothetical protein
MAGGLVLLAAGPAAACTCSMFRSEAARAARADAVFVGELVGGTVDPLTWGGEAWSRPYLPPAVYIFEVSRVYKGAVSQRQEIITPGGGTAACGGLGLRGPGPFLVFAHQGSNALLPARPVRLVDVLWITVAGQG